MNNLPAVSVYIVTYLNSEERGRILKRTCEWVLAQRYPNFEVVVSDNGGDYAAKDALVSIQDARLKVCANEENAGFTGNINRCLKHCSNDIIKPLCDDDLMHLDFLAVTAPLVDDETLVVTDVKKFQIGRDPEALTNRIETKPGTENRMAGYGQDIWRLSYSDSCIISATLFTRELFSSLGGFDNNTITSDWDFFIEACLQRRIIHVKQVLCYVGIWKGSLTEEMVENPFFFATENLYTKFRVFHCKTLPYRSRQRLLLSLVQEFMWQSLRPLKHLHEKGYRVGYCDYARRFFILLRQGKRAFASRSDQPK